MHCYFIVVKGDIESEFFFLVSQRISSTSWSFLSGMREGRYMNQYVKDYHQYTNEINYIPSQLVLFSFSPGFSGANLYFTCNY